jgi:3-oxoacyl-[acyl-carrier-protein] synthase II
MYDRCEVAAYKAALGQHAYRIPFTAMKSMTGQAYAAGGLLSAAGVLMSLREGILSPTINLEDPDPVCDLDFVPNTARLCDVNTALVAGISFGGTYSCCILRNMN